MSLIVIFLFTLNFAVAKEKKSQPIYELRGILIRGGDGYIPKIEQLRKSGITFKDLLVPDESALYLEMEKYLSHPVSMDLLDSMKQTIVHHYQSHGYPIVGVVIPEQDVTDGYLVIEVIIGRLGTVHGEGAKYFSNEKIAAMIRTQPNEYIRSSRMAEDLDWINDNPFRSTQLIYEPGSEPGQTNVSLVTKDRFPLKPYAGYQNTGNIIAGRSRYYAGIDWGNAWGIGHRINYQWSTADPINNWYAHCGNYIAPLPWRNFLELFGAYVSSKPPEGDDTDLNGDSWQVITRYIIPFRTFEIMKNNVSISYEFKRTNNFLSFATDQIFDDSIDVSQFVIGYGFDLNYRRGMTSFEVSLYLSPGGMTAFNKDRNFAQERTGATSNYIYGKLRLDQVLNLPNNFSWVLNTLFQQASGKLLPSEEISLGGFATVRGYDENEVIGDNGILIKNELRSPSLLMLKSKKIPHTMQFLIFVDFGYTYDADQSILNQENEVLASIGPGVRYAFGDYLSIRFDYGWQLDSIMRKVDESHRHSMGHFGLHCSY
ncbi:MAG: ShlB/FhaC/HecB family hemolysin secretion/activation protein [Simkaniaceae bacterium]